MAFLWATCLNPETLVNVGMDAIGMFMDNNICFLNLKTKEKLYYTPNHPTVGCSVTLLAGHNRFDLFAFAEAVLRPRIFVMKYPEFTKHCVFNSDKVATYLDIRFSEYEHLIGLTGYPKYIFRIWNFRTSHLLLEHETREKCSRFSVLCSGNNNPMIVQYSNWLKKICVWEMCFTEERYQLHNISRISLPKAHSHCTYFCMTFSEDGNLYIVNDYGTVSLVEIAQFYLQAIWSASLHEKPRRYCLVSHKQGLLVSNSEMVYYIKRKSSRYVVEWVLEDPTNMIKKMVSSFNNEAYAVDYFGNVFQLEYDSNTATAKLVDLNTSNYTVLDFVLLRGVKEEVFVILTSKAEVRLVDVVRLQTFSMVQIADAVCMAPHNTWSCIAVATSTGHLHFIAYEKTRQPPVILAVLDLETIALQSLRLFDTTVFGHGTDNTFHALHADFKGKEFDYLSVIENFPPNKELVVLSFYLPEQHRAMVFVSHEKHDFKRYATELWIYKWSYGDNTHVQKEIIDLPHKYSYINSMLTVTRDSIEFSAVRVDTIVFDIFVLSNRSVLTLTTTVKTCHISFIYGINGNRNITTWGAGGMIYHFRAHKKATEAFGIGRLLRPNFVPRLIARSEQCFNAKYFLNLYHNGKFKGHRFTSMSDNLRENKFLTVPTENTFSPRVVQSILIKTKDKEGQIVTTITDDELALKEQIAEQLKAIAVELTALINYDMSVTGKKQGIFRKFCLNSRWLDRLNQEAQRLFDMERAALDSTIQEQAKIRDYIKKTINFSAQSVSIKCRALFSNTVFDNYSMSVVSNAMDRRYDYYQFYDMDPVEDDYGQQDEDEVTDKGVAMAKTRKFYVVTGKSVFNHIMSPEFYMQDINDISANMMFNRQSKFKLALTNPLRIEFNKMFDEARAFKQEIMDGVINTNAQLMKIYKNMNCMLCLLNMPTFVPQNLSVPEWTKDEVVERIMEVDDSEIKAINRRKKKLEISDGKRGRMLLWSVEFWKRALITMMDGVLEKLWEEEIKKDIPLPEFMTKKQVHEYTLEDQKQLREYDEKVRLLAEDRRKYLRMLGVSETKTMQLKTDLIMKLNERCAQMAITKLKYDFALRIGRLRLCNLKRRHIERIHLREVLKNLRFEDEKLTAYIARYSKLVDFYEKSVNDIKLRLDYLHVRDKAVDRQFRGQFLGSLPANQTNEILKLYKRRPRVTQKSFTSTLVCLEASNRLTQRHARSHFPLPTDVLDFLRLIESLDQPQNIPNQLDQKYWENFIKIRRQKMDYELKIKGNILYQVDTQNAVSWFLKEMALMKEARLLANASMEQSRLKYNKAVQNQYLQITLSMGQVEVSFDGSLDQLTHSILMHVDDVNGVNDLIKSAGLQKLKAMERVAFFRRQVIFKEWEHKVVRANIEYLKYILQVIEKCKVTMEFLQILRNWKKVYESRHTTSSVGLLERVVEQKLGAYRKNLDRLIEKIDKVKAQIQEIKRKNQELNREIDDLKVSAALANVDRDFLLEEKNQRERTERMAKIKLHSCLMETVRRDYMTILELKTILELQRLRTYPTLGPAPPQCPPNENFM